MLFYSVPVQTTFLWILLLIVMSCSASACASSPKESKKHLAGLGTLGLGSLITEITANEVDNQDGNKDSGVVDEDGEGKCIKEHSINPA